MIPSAFLISCSQISRGPSQHKSGSLNNKYEYHSTSQNTLKQRAKIPCQCTNPFSVTSSEPLPKSTRKPFRGHGRPCRPRAPWPPQRSAARPRRRGRSEPPHAAASSLGCCGCRRETKRSGVAMGCFSGWLGKKMWIGHTDRYR